MNMALKFTSIAELLQMGGNGGVSGDTGHEASTSAGLRVPTVAQHPSPLALADADSGAARIPSGSGETQYPCGFQGGDPTVPTVPTQSAIFADFETPIPEPAVDPATWRELAAAYHAHHFSCPECIAAGRGSGYGLRCGIGMTLWRAYSP